MSNFIANPKINMIPDIKNMIFKGELKSYSLELTLLKNGLVIIRSINQLDKRKETKAPKIVEISIFSFLLFCYIFIK